MEGRGGERRGQAHSASTCKLRAMGEARPARGEGNWFQQQAWGKHKRNSVAKRTRSLWIHCLLGPEQQGPLDAVSDSSPSD